MGYCVDDSFVRVDFFKESGKWYSSESVKWTGGYSKCCIHEAFYESLESFFISAGSNYSGMTAVCLEPYHEHAHPLTAIIKGPK